jgi:hypothetical protein
MEQMFERLKWWTGILLDMLSLCPKDGGQECLWACSVFNHKAFAQKKERTLWRYVNMGVCP